MITIKLRKEQWSYDPNVPLGTPGGFGAVFLGKGPDGEKVAVKRLHISSDSAGNRELAIAEELEGKDFHHVIAIYDSGMDAESGQYFVVMAKAEKSLQDLLNNGPLNEKNAISILIQIASGIAEIKDFVHRDLKPGNILLHEGVWKLADFGIARFVEKATSSNTLRDCLSPHYAAPEQWRLERATNATDIYAFGCIAYALLTGCPPFPSGDICAQHLHQEAPLPSASPRMKQLVSLCLRKNPNARPSIVSILRQIKSIGSGFKLTHSIAAAGAAIAQEQAKKEAEAAQKQTEREKRIELATDAFNSLHLILDMMFQSIIDNAPVAGRLGQHAIGLGSGKLFVKMPFSVFQVSAFPNWGKNIICGAFICVYQSNPHYSGRSSNLWFGELGSPGEFRWWEISYFGLGGQISSFEPFGIEHENKLEHADYAGSSIFHSVQLASKPVPIDGENTEEFIKRWSDRLAAASMNELQKPSTLPEQ